MDSRIVTSLSLTAVAAVAAVGLSAAPAEAAGPPGYLLQGAYTWPDYCATIGYTGVANHSWRAYFCETITPTTFNGPGVYDLWVLY